jgi:hypothetical protein
MEMNFIWKFVGLVEIYNFVANFFLFEIILVLK